MSVCPYREPTANVRLLSIGEGAKWTQWMLNACGAKLTVDGIFGPLSVKALKAFQTANRLSTDGVCGPATRLALKNSQAKQNAFAGVSAEACPYQEPSGSLAYGSRGDGVKWIQWHLNRHGAALSVDGDFGNATKAALVAFQRVNGLSADAVCGPATKAALRGAESAKPLTDTQKELLSMRDAMLDYIEKRVGDIYVYGAQGEIAGDAVIDWSARLFPQYTTPSRVAKMKDYVASHPCNPQGETLRAFDCSGLFWAAENLVELPLDAKRDVDDSTAAGLYNTYCVPVSKNDLHPLDLVFNSSLTHVAVVGRNGRVYEAAGSDIGVVMNVNVNTRLLKSIYTGVLYRKADWTKFGRLKIFYDAGL